jgi:hypothetical protein
MSSRDARALEIMEAIAAVLLKDWDPIGVKDEPMAQDEYESQIGRVYRLLASGATEQQVAEHLSRVESEEMGFTNSTAEPLLPVARKLLALNVRLGDDSAA